MEENLALLPLAIILFATSTGFVIHHAKRGTSAVVLLLSIMSFGLGSAAVALLPIDLSYASSSSSEVESDDTDESDVDGGDGNDDTTTTSHNNPTYPSWRGTYWATFFLAWLVLPITRETLLSGHFALHRRLRDGAYRSFRSILLMICFGILSVIGMALHLRSLHLVAVVLPVLMALSNTYGLLLVSLLLGNGLVNIPKRLWRISRPEHELRRVRIVSCGAEEELFDSVMALEDVEDRIEEVCRSAVCLGEVNNNIGVNGEIGSSSRIRTRRKWCICMPCPRCSVDEVTEFHECLEVLVRRKNETSNLCIERRTRSRTAAGGGGGGGGGSRSSGGSSPRRRGAMGGRGVELGVDVEDTDGGGDNNYGGGMINTMDVKYLVHLNGQLKTAQERVTSAQLRWNHLMEHSRLFSLLMDDDYNGSAMMSDDMHPPPCCRKLRHRLQRLWVRYLRYPTYRCASVITAALSTFVLLSEVTLASPLNLSPFSWTLHALDKYYQYENSSTRVLFQISALVPLLYMSICVYACLFQMSLLGPYCLRGNRQSTGVALVFNAQYLVRLQFPLGYNYLLM
jgi:hypothetical protein